MNSRLNVLPSTLRAKLTGVFLLPTVLILVVFSVIVYAASRQGLEDELGKRLVAIAQTFASQTSELDAKQLSRLDPSKTRVIARFSDQIDALQRTTNATRVFIANPDRLSIVDTDQTAFGESIYVLNAHQREFDSVLESGEAKTTVLFSSEGGFNKMGFAPIILEDEVIAVIGVEGSATYFTLLNNLATVLFVLVVVAMLLVVVVAATYSKRITHPVGELVAAARRLGKGELEEPVKIESANDEIGFLTQSFEEMRKDIVRRDEQMQMMLSGIAHEVRNPLGGMSLFCGLLKEDLKDQPTPMIQVEKIEKELGYLEHVVTDFLEFARNVPVVPERFPAKDFLVDVVSLLENDASHAGVELVWDVEPFDLEISGDLEKLRRAVINVVRNACQACSDGDEIKITVAAPSTRTRVLTIQDTGPGIDESDLERVMTPFFTTREKGSGLGLALTRRIVDQHRGEMTIESRLGDGTKIVFNLPFDQTVRPTGSFSQSDIPEGWLG